MADIAHLSESMEMYLKAIHLIEQRKRAARVTDIAHELGVIPSSVSAALRALSKLGLVNYAPYDIVTLTPQGLEVAEQIMRKYDALRDFFVKVLGVEESTAESEACQMEHRISEAIFSRLLSFVDYYEQCPYERIRWDERVGYSCSRNEARCRHCEIHTGS